MARKPSEILAIEKINQHGMLLVFPIVNRPEPNSLWREFFPRTKMNWEWDDHADNRVVQMWQLMKSLSTRTEVVYSKWFQGRATFLSRELFAALLSLSLSKFSDRNLLPEAAAILEILVSDSPLSTKQLKAAVELQGRDNEPIYQRAMKQLFGRMLIVAHGEVDDGAFPSLAVAATETLFEDLWLAAKDMDEELGLRVVHNFFNNQSSVFRFASRTLHLA